MWDAQRKTYSGSRKNIWDQKGIYQSLGNGPGLTGPEAHSSANDNNSAQLRTIVLFFLVDRCFVCVLAIVVRQSNNLKCTHARFIRLLICRGFTQCVGVCKTSVIDV